jgi:site-specific DNA-methyltransferase (adenine-specific)
MIKPITKNTLYYGDNLDILREYIPDESVDLIYLDPPFNSNRSYNVLFRDESGKDAEAQITAFEDTWHWGEDAQRTYHDLVQEAPANVSTMISALREFIGANQMMAYLVMMTARLIELHRVLKPTGSIYLHCDPTASHYLKIVLDTIFGGQYFQNEIYWKRKYGRTGPIRRFGTACDVILFYTKSQVYTFYNQYGESDPDYIEAKFRFIDDNGRRYRIDNLASPNPRPNLMYEYKGYKPPAKGWAISREKMEQWDREGKLHFPKSTEGRIQRRSYLDELKGEEVQNLWDDILPIGAHAQERLGYPTQKPLALLERIIQASSNEGDVVLDPFCGCGTAIAAAQKLNRKWIGIDVTHLSIALMKYRLKDSFSLAEKKDYAVIGEPESLSGARQLATDDRYQFQWWALSLVQAKPLGAEGSSREGKKGSDKGIDGIINFINEKNKLERILVQVKSGHVKSGDIRDLRGAVEREGAAMGVFITLEEPSKDMVVESVSGGFYHSNLWQQDYQRIQVLTVEDLLSGRKIDMPRSIPGQTFKQAEKIKKADATQDELL